MNISFCINSAYDHFNYLLSYISFYPTGRKAAQVGFKALIGGSPEPSKILIQACQEYTRNPQYKLTTGDKNELRKFIFAENNQSSNSGKLVTGKTYSLFKQLESLFINPTTSKPYKGLILNTSLSNTYEKNTIQSPALLSFCSLLPSARSVGYQYPENMAHSRFANFTANPFFLTSNIYTSFKSLEKELLNSSITDLQRTIGIQCAQFYDEAKVQQEQVYRIFNKLSSNELFPEQLVTQQDLAYREIQYIKSILGDQITSLYEISIDNFGILTRFKLTNPQTFMAVVNKNGKLEELYHRVKGNSFSTSRIHDQPLNKDPQKSSLIWTM